MTDAAGGPLASPPVVASTAPAADEASEAWVEGLRATGPAREEALARLHALLLRAARFEAHRRAGGDERLREVLEDVAQQSADDALVAVLAKLDGFRGESRFTTWAYKFAILETAVALRRLAWQGREIPTEHDRPVWGADRGASPERRAQVRELLDATRAAIERDLTPHQREVLVALALDGVPIDVLAERLGTTRGALYKTLHDARARLRGELRARGFELSSFEEGGAG